MKNEEAKRKAYTLGLQYEEEHYNCAQCTVAAIQDALGVRNDDVFRAASGLAGGIGIAGDCCGACTGGVMMLSYLHGRTREQFPEPGSEGKYSMKAYELAKRLRDMFIEEYGSVICRDIQKKILGRSFNFWDPKENREFEEAGGHTADKCPSVVGRSAQWVIEILP